MLLSCLQPKIWGSYRSFKTRQPRLFSVATDFILLHPLRRELHCLPIDERVIFTVLLLIFKGMSNLIPAYLSDLLIKYVSGRENLRSGNENLLCVSHTKRAIGDCSFSVAGPCLWNALPSHIRFSLSVSIFKKSLKTHLFPTDWLHFIPGIISCVFNIYVPFIIFISFWLFLIIKYFVCNHADVLIFTVYFDVFIQCIVQRCDHFEIALYKSCVIIILS